MSDNPELKIRERVQKLEETVKVILEGLKALELEIEDQWGDQFMKPGVYYGVEFKS